MSVDALQEMMKLAESQQLQSNPSQLQLSPSTTQSPDMEKAALLEALERIRSQGSDDSPLFDMLIGGVAMFEDGIGEILGSFEKIIAEYKVVLAEKKATIEHDG